LENGESATHTILLSASLKGPLAVHFEPVDGEHALAAGEHFRLLIQGPTNESLEIAHERDAVTVWPSARLKVRVFDMSGTELDILGF
jgi:hypothetical protein